MSLAVLGMGEMVGGEERRLPRFLVSSLVAHGVGLLLFFLLGLHFSVPSPSPLKVRLVEAPPPSAAAPAAPAGPPSPALTPRAEPARTGGPTEFVEAPKPKVEEAPRSKRFAGIYDRRGGPAAKGPAPATETVSKAPLRPPAGVLRGEEVVPPPALPPAEPAPSVSLPAVAQNPSAQETTVARAEPISPGRTALVQPAPPAPAQGPPAPAPRTGAAPAGRGPSFEVRPPARRLLRAQVDSLPPDYRPPLEEPGTAGDAAGHGDPGLETFRYKYGTWLLAAKRDIERAWKVPVYGLSSLAVVRFIVLPDGKIRDLQLERSAGLNSLDKAAMGAISGAVPFRPFPPRMKEENPGGIDLTVSFEYRQGGPGILQWE